MTFDTPLSSQYLLHSYLFTHHIPSISVTTPDGNTLPVFHNFITIIYSTNICFCSARRNVINTVYKDFLFNM